MSAAVTSDMGDTLCEIQAKRPRISIWGDSCRDLYRFVRRSGERFIEDSRQEFYGMAGGVREACEAIGATVCEYSRDTCTHERIVCDGNVVSWIESVPPQPEQLHVPNRISRSILENEPHALLISDYGRGTCSPDGLRWVIEAVQDSGAVVIVDPHSQADWSRYAGAAVIKASEEHARPTNPIPRTCVVTTAGRNGMTLFQPDGEPDFYYFETTPIDDAHPCGAGDVVLAALGCCVAAGIDLARACRFANAVAACKCRRLGPLSMSPAELRAAIA